MSPAPETRTTFSWRSSIAIVTILILATGTSVQADDGYGGGNPSSGHVGGAGRSYGMSYSSFGVPAHGYSHFGVRPSLGFSHFGVGPSLGYSHFGVGPSLGYPNFGNAPRQLYIAPTYPPSSLRTWGRDYQNQVTQRSLTPQAYSMKSGLVRPQVMLNADGTPAGELRPGMVLPDGAIVISVGPPASPKTPDR